MDISVLKSEAIQIPEQVPHVVKGKLQMLKLKFSVLRQLFSIFNKTGNELVINRDLWEKDQNTLASRC